MADSTGNILINVWSNPLFLIPLLFGVSGSALFGLCRYFGHTRSTSLVVGLLFTVILVVFNPVEGTVPNYSFTPFYRSIGVEETNRLQRSGFIASQYGYLERSKQVRLLLVLSLFMLSCGLIELRTMNRGISTQCYPANRGKDASDS